MDMRLNHKNHSPGTWGTISDQKSQCCLLELSQLELNLNRQPIIILGQFR